MKIINVTDITEYLYCPRKVYLKLVKGIRFPPTRQMIFGMLRHKVFDLFNKNESALVSSIKTKLISKEIEKLYFELLDGVSKEIFYQNSRLAGNFDIKFFELLESVEESMKPEIKLRVDSILQVIENFLGKELWRNLKPKYLTEYSLESPEIGLKGRVDRIKFADNIEPVEIKTRDKVYDSDKIQLAAYALLLENEFGKKIETGVIEFKGKQEQVVLDEQLKSEVLKLAEEIRNMTEGKMPSNFSKCEKCNYKEECMS